MKKISRNNSTKKILIIILALMISSFMGYRFALAQSGNALKSVVEPGSMTSEASYVIFTDGTNYYARNGTTGEIEFSGTNASTVIQNTINTLTSGRTWKEKVVLKGNFSLSAPIKLPSYTTLEIDGILQAVSGFPPNTGIIYNRADIGEVTNIEIQGGVIDGNKDAGIQAYGIALGRIGTTDSVSGVTVKNVYVKNCYYHAFAIRPYAEHVLIEDCIADNNSLSGFDLMGAFQESSYDPHTFDVWIMNCKAMNNQRHGIDINSGATRVWVTNFVATANCLANTVNDAAVVVSSFAQAVTLQNAMIFDNGVSNSPATFAIRAVGHCNLNIDGGKIYTTTNPVLGVDGIRFWDGAMVKINGLTVTFNGTQNAIYADHYGDPNPACIITDCTFDNVSTAILLIDQTDAIVTDNIISNANYGIYESGTADYNIIENNDLRGMTGNKITKLGAHTIVENNQGYVTENTGITTVANNVWIPHGLVTTPTTVTITSMNSTYSNESLMVSWTNSNSTHFQVGVYWANGTAITNDVIGVSWHAEV